MLSERARYERDQQVQRPWGANVPGMFEEQQGDWGNWSGEVCSALVVNDQADLLTGRSGTMSQCHLP